MINDEALVQTKSLSDAAVPDHEPEEPGYLVIAGNTDDGDLRLGFASDDFAGTKWKNLTETTRWSDGTEMVTLDYSHLTSVLWGVCKGFQARWTSWKPGRPSGGRRTSKHGGAEGPGRRLQRAGPAEAVPTCEAARP